jgi:holo-[acyl-carrier protein] synthase
MAVYGVGIDLVRVDRIEEMLSRWGDRFAARVFTELEVKICSGRRTRVSCLAMRFAAKEAFVKALGLGIRSPVVWRDIEIQSDSLGKPEIVLSERARQFCRDQGIKSWHVSLTDDGQYGAAVVVIESWESARTLSGNQ